MLNQRTIAKKISVTGIGVHTGKKVTISLHPAAADFGIRFRRVDIPNSVEIVANAETVSTTENATTIGKGKEAVNTVEHLLAVLYGFGINNLYCEIDGPEVPIMDGSGISFAYLIKEAGITNLGRAKNFLIVTSPVRVQLDDKWAEITPASKLIIDATIVFAHSVVKKQQYNFEFSCESFINEICRARTFGFLRDVDMLKRKGLAKGGSLDNVIILDDYNVVNPDGLRFKDEFVRHKILDTIGDVALLGYEIAGKITTYKSGHNLHNLLCRKLLATPSAYRIVSSTYLQKETVSNFELPHAIAPIFN